MIVRDFIYVDGDRLYSLYSQVFEGVAERIIQSYIDELTSTDTQKASPLGGASAATQVAEASRRTENRLLYDHMYSQLEAKLTSAITEPTGLSQDNYVDELSRTFMIKVRGAAEIEDYERLQAFIANFNALGQAIAYAGMMSSGALDDVKSVDLAVGSIKDPNQRARAKHKAKHLNVKALAGAMGLQQDEQLLSNLKLFGEMFNREGFEVTITPEHDAEGIVFRGVLDKRWLRTRPEFLRSLYGINPVANWTMIGQITHLPGVMPRQPQGEQPPAGSGSDSENPSMRDPFRAMFGSSGAFEKMFLESHQRTEVVIAPLAVYREYSLETDRKSVGATSA